MKYKTEDEMVETYKKMIDRLKTGGISPKNHILDNDCIFMKHKVFKHSELQCVQRWVRVDNRVSESHMFKDILDQEYEIEVVFESNAYETPMHSTDIENINSLL